MAAEVREGPGELKGLFVLRRSVHRFLSTRAASWWQGFSVGELDIVVPPELAAWPPRKRFTALAKLERQRIVRSRLFQLDEMAAEAAVRGGAKIRTAGHGKAVARAGRAEVVESFGTAPPAACGFLRWAGPVGDDPTWGSPIRVCHWGPQGGGVWMTWWAEVETAAEAMPGALGKELRTFAGLVFPVYSVLLAAGQPASDRDARSAGPGPAEGAGQVDDDIALIYTTLGSWLLLTRPGAAVVTDHQPSVAEAAADRRAGMHHSVITHAAGIGAPEVVAW